jgi:hypothetical protein
MILPIRGPFIHILVDKICVLVKNAYGLRGWKNGQRFYNQIRWIESALKKVNDMPFVIIYEGGGGEGGGDEGRGGEGNKRFILSSLLPVITQYRKVIERIIYSKWSKCISISLKNKILASTRNGSDSVLRTMLLKRIWWCS